MNRIDDKYWMPSRYAKVFQDSICQHTCEQKIYKVYAPFTNIVRRFLKYCTHCGLITDGL